MANTNNPRALNIRRGLDEFKNVSSSARHRVAYMGFRRSDARSPPSLRPQVVIWWETFLILDGVRTAAVRSDAERSAPYRGQRVQGLQGSRRAFAIGFEQEAGEAQVTDAALDCDKGLSDLPAGASA